MAAAEHDNQYVLAEGGKVVAFRRLKSFSNQLCPCNLSGAENNIPFKKFVSGLPPHPHPRHKMLIQDKEHN